MELAAVKPPKGIGEKFGVECELTTGAKLMKRKISSWLLTAILMATTFADAQQPKKVPRIGYLAAGDRSS